MPHAEENGTLTNGEMSNSTPMTNGEKPSSKVLSHLQSYPVVSDALSLYTSNPYGAKSVNFSRALYQKLVAPLHPYLQTPYSYLSPYLSRADELGDSGLQKVDSTFPIVKEDTGKLKEKVQGVAFLPLHFAGQGKEYVLGTWKDEYKKTKGDDGVVKSVFALVSTELKIGKDGYTLVREYLAKGKEEGSKKVNEIKQ
jgi:hypothetical protein